MYQEHFLVGNTSTLRGIGQIRTFFTPRKLTLLLELLPKTLPRCCAPLPRTLPGFSKGRSECKNGKLWCWDTLQGALLAPSLLSGGNTTGRRIEGFGFAPSAFPWDRESLRFSTLVMAKAQVCTETTQEGKAVTFWGNPVRERKSPENQRIL